MTEDFSYSLPIQGHDKPIAARDERAGLLVVADWIDQDELAPVAEAAGLRLLGTIDLSEAAARLDEQTQCDTLLLFCPSSAPLLERLLVQVETQAIQTGMAVILVAGWDTVELAFACVRSPRRGAVSLPHRTA